MADETEEKETPNPPEPEAADAAASEEAGEPAAEAAGEPEPEAAAEAAAPESEAGEDDSAESVAAEPAPEQATVADAPDLGYAELHAMNVNQLREVAAKIDHEAVHGYSTMHKEHLVPAICKAIGIEAHEHHEVVGIDKEKVKAKIRLLKRERDEAESAGDSARLKLTRRRIRSLKRKIRKATV